jgi:hypothetical protein
VGAAAGEAEERDAINPRVNSPVSHRWEPIIRASSLVSATALLLAAPACALDFSTLGDRLLPMALAPPSSESSAMSATVSSALLELSGVPKSLRAAAAAAATAAAAVAPPPADPAAHAPAPPYARAKFAAVPITQSLTVTTARADGSRPLGAMGQALETAAVRREVELLVQEEIQSRLRSMSSEELLQTLDGLKRLDANKTVVDPNSLLLSSPLFPNRSSTPSARDSPTTKPSPAPSGSQMASPGVAGSEVAPTPSAASGDPPDAEATNLYDGPSWRDFLGASMDPARASATSRAPPTVKATAADNDETSAALNFSTTTTTDDATESTELEALLILEEEEEPEEAAAEDDPWTLFSRLEVEEREYRARRAAEAELNPPSLLQRVQARARQLRDGAATVTGGAAGLQQTAVGLLPEVRVTGLPLHRLRQADRALSQRCGRPKN